ncbi:MAG: hypothetical protein ABS78_00580 [Phenylobacterium sp. SCN 70-31]|nr:MAG: hypothetical protein ABS78_00580 [Phenylobacterium sp. SCN 70-31]
MTGRLACIAYVAACAAALAAGAVVAVGWMGPGPGRVALAVVFGLSLPWSLLAYEVAGAGPVGRLVMSAAAMALNLAIAGAVVARFLRPR